MNKVMIFILNQFLAIKLWDKELNLGGSAYETDLNTNSPHDKNYETKINETFSVFFEKKDVVPSAFLVSDPYQNRTGVFRMKAGFPSTRRMGH